MKTSSFLRKAAFTAFFSLAVFPALCQNPATGAIQPGGAAVVRPVRNEYHFGADLSFLKQVEDNGFNFKENGEVKPGMLIFADHGYNWIRLRLMHTPSAWTGTGGKLPNDLDYTIAMAQQAKKYGMKFLLNYHYSDTWADPGKQYIPAAWMGKSQDELVQAGNEITPGFLWPNGKIPENPQGFIKGGDKVAAKLFFDRVIDAGIPFDVIGQSYYRWWHGTLMDLRENLNFMALEYDKDIIVVEIAYNMEPREYINR